MLVRGSPSRITHTSPPERTIMQSGCDELRQREREPPVLRAGKRHD
jgi:hypothetical protein